MEKRMEAVTAAIKTGKCGTEFVKTAMEVLKAILASPNSQDASLQKELQRHENVAEMEVRRLNQILSAAFPLLPLAQKVQVSNIVHVARMLTQPNDIENRTTACIQYNITQLQDIATQQRQALQTIVAAGAAEAVLQMVEEQVGLPASDLPPSVSGSMATVTIQPDYDKGHAQKRARVSSKASPSKAQKRQ